MKKKFVPILAAGALIVVIICFMLLGSIIEKYTPSKAYQYKYMSQLFFPALY
jgi:hypothetical protein